MTAMDIMKWFLAAAAAAGAGTVWERPLLADPSAGSGTAGGGRVGVFALDSLVYRHTRADFADLRVYGAGPRPLGSVAAPAARRASRCAAAPVSLRRLGAEITGDSVFEAVYLAEDPAQVPDRIGISIDARDFEVPLTLWTAPSADAGGPRGGNWTRRLHDVPLFDYSRFADWRREKAEWRAGSDRAVKVRIGGLTRSRRSPLSTLSGGIGKPDAETFEMERAPLRVESIAFARESCREIDDGPILDTVGLSFGPSPRIAEPDAKRTWYLFDGGRLPLEGLLIAAAPGRFLRSATLTGLGEDAGGPSEKPWAWPRLGEGVIHRVDWGGHPDSSLRIASVPGGRYARLALGILDRDDPPLELLGARAEVRRMVLYFPADAPGPHAVRYGDPDAVPLQSEFAALLERGGRAAAAGYRLGPPRPILSDKPAPEPEGRAADLLLKAGLAAAVLALILLIAWAAKKAGKQGA